MRDQHAADLVALFKPYANDGLCGYAWIGGYGSDGDFSNPAEADFGYSVVASNCSDYTLIHELGHNLGLAHSRREDPAGGTFAWSAGHGEDHSFVTIMASPGVFNATRVGLFSSPSETCMGMPCGQSKADAVHGADAVDTLEVTIPQVAAYR